MLMKLAYEVIDLGPGPVKIEITLAWNAEFQLQAGHKYCRDTSPLGTDWSIDSLKVGVCA